ncbi:MAG: hypothetical protein HRK26_00010 [Rickettsiaceae bacterium H1]|nr:hypothetical protein [Rickettsiaceae bacterium H1]
MEDKKRLNENPFDSIDGENEYSSNVKKIAKDYFSKNYPFFRQNNLTQ